jgi:hypothetical protein
MPQMALDTRLMTAWQARRCARQAGDWSGPDSQTGTLPARAASPSARTKTRASRCLSYTRLKQDSFLRAAVPQPAQRARRSSHSLLLAAVRALLAGVGWRIGQHSDLGDSLGRRRGLGGRGVRGRARRGGRRGGRTAYMFWTAKGKLPPGFGTRVLFARVGSGRPRGSRVGSGRVRPAASAGGSGRVAARWGGP